MHFCGETYGWFMVSLWWDVVPYGPANLAFRECGFLALSFLLRADKSVSISIDNDSKFEARHDVPDGDDDRTDGAAICQ